MILKSDVKNTIEIIRVDNNIYTIVDYSNMSFINKINNKGEITGSFLHIDHEYNYNLIHNFLYYAIDDTIIYILGHDNIINFKLLPDKLKDCILLRKLQE